MRLLTQQHIAMIPLQQTRALRRAGTALASKTAQGTSLAQHRCGSALHTAACMPAILTHAACLTEYSLSWMHARPSSFLRTSGERCSRPLTHAPCSMQGGPAIQRSSSGGPSRFRGVIWHKSNSKWEARIYEAGKQRFLGYYTSEAEAARVYDEAALRLTGRAVNFPIGPGGAAGLAESLSRANSAPEEAQDPGETAGAARGTSTTCSPTIRAINFKPARSPVFRKPCLPPQHEVPDVCIALLLVLTGGLLSVCLRADIADILRQGRK